MKKGDEEQIQQQLQQWIQHGYFTDRNPQLGRTARQRINGIIKQQRLLDRIIDLLAQRKPQKELKPPLWSGLYTLLLSPPPGVPIATPVNACVEAAKQTLHPSQVRFVNALLRRATRETQTLNKKITAFPPDVRYSHPSKLYRGWVENYGEHQTKNIMEWNNQFPPIWFRVRQHLISPNELQQVWAEKNIQAEVHPQAPYLKLKNHTGKSLTAFPGYTQGLFYVQDPATRYAVELLDAQPHETIWDACAAPGGKLLALADAMQQQGTLLATEAHQDRLGALKQNIQRLQHTWIQLQQQRAENHRAPTSYDAILLDVPCTNTGVLQRRPEARWRVQPERQQQLKQVQEKLLETALQNIKPTGRIIYSTCSIEPQENQKRIQHVLEKYPGWHIQHELQCLPGQENSDGAYAARIQANP